MEPRLRPLRQLAFGLLAAALLVCGPWVGWWTLAPLLGAGIAFTLTDRGLESSGRPEYRLAAAWCVAELAIAASVALTGGPHSPALAWIVLPVVTLPARFDRRGVLAGSALAGVLILASSLGVDPAAVIADPASVVFALALLGAIALLSVALMHSDLQHRRESVIDPLTSMLNRHALNGRVDELRDQARVVHQPVGLIVGDLDHFKQINDTHGHATGDAVLRDVAYSLRKCLRAFDLAYRLGGEEFLVLLPGADPDQAAHVAEALRATIDAGQPGGLAVTMSFGVSASPPDSFDYNEVFRAADAALYAAKAGGRNRVEVAGAIPVR
ncbi:GGDEF domain-containing protein [Conexibacter sp. DBS9H8]|uniref:GGDEF domain-containing protein n=1 Tax=Conexibacter sp. DBS9H8 TaxID=2937801 RepID=UPI00201045BB|nr:GGDEF domain-containing protein [Conexibacter sp. DBS9H8]